MPQDYDTPEGFDEANRDALLEYGADFAVLAGYLNILGEKTVNEFRNRIINIHPALIPSFCGKGYYGKNVHTAVCESGVKLSGPLYILWTRAPTQAL
jgi:phosphoribosylglycinamide formyltransferase-1